MGYKKARTAKKRKQRDTTAKSRRKKTKTAKNSERKKAAKTKLCTSKHRCSVFYVFFCDPTSSPEKTTEKYPFYLKIRAAFPLPDSERRGSSRSRSAADALILIFSLSLPHAVQPVHRLPSSPFLRFCSSWQASFQPPQAFSPLRPFRFRRTQGLKA